MLVVRSEPCFQQVLQSLRYLGREQEAPASPRGLDPQDAFFSRVGECPVVFPRLVGAPGGWFVENCCPCLPETSGQDKEIPCENVKLYRAASWITQELNFEDHKELGKISKEKYIALYSLALAQVLESP